MKKLKVSYLAEMVSKYVPQIGIPPNTANHGSMKHSKMLNTGKRYCLEMCSNSDAMGLKCTTCANIYNFLLKESKRKFYTFELPSLILTSPRNLLKFISPKESQHSILLHNSTGEPIPDNPVVLNGFFALAFTVG